MMLTNLKSNRKFVIAIYLGSGAATTYTNTSVGLRAHSVTILLYPFGTKGLWHAELAVMGLYVLPALTLLIALSRRHLPQVRLEGRRGHIVRAAIASSAWIIALASTMSLGMFIVLAAPFLVLAPFGGGWLACRIVRPERHLIMRLGWGILCGTAFFCIAAPVILSSVGVEKISGIGEYRIAVYVGAGLFIASWLGALIVAGSSPLRSNAERLPKADVMPPS